MTPILATLETAARLLAITPTELLEAVRGGDLPKPVAVGHQLRWNVAALTRSAGELRAADDAETEDLARLHVDAHAADLERLVCGWKELF